MRFGFNQLLKNVVLPAAMLALPLVGAAQAHSDIHLGGGGSTPKPATPKPATSMSAPATALQAPVLNPDSNYAFHWNDMNMDVVVLRDAQVGMIKAGDAAKVLQEPGTAVVSSPLFAKDKQPVGGYNIVDQTGKSSEKSFVDPNLPQFKGTNFGLRNYIFQKVGITGPAQTFAYQANMSAQNLEGAVFQGGMQLLSSGQNLADPNSQNRNERMAIGGSLEADSNATGKSVLLIRCESCTPYELGQAASMLGAQELGYLDGGKGVTGFSVNMSTLTNPVQNTVSFSGTPQSGSLLYINTDHNGGNASIPPSGASTLKRKF